MVSYATLQTRADTIARVLIHSESRMALSAQNAKHTPLAQYNLMYGPKHKATKVENLSLPQVR
jgi:hypothetical protein